MNPYLSHVAAYEAHGEHTPSWFTLTELLSANWEQEITLRGFVSKDKAEHFYKYKGKYPPREYCGWTSDKTAVQIEWKSTVEEECPAIFAALVRMWKLAPNGDTDRVRLVFWFDS